MQIDGKQWKQWLTLFFWAQKSLQMVIGIRRYNGDEIRRRLLLGRKVMTNIDSILKKQRHYFVNKGPSSESYGFSLQ